MFNYKTKNMYIVKDRYEKTVGIFDSKEEALGFVNIEDEYHIGVEVNYCYKNYYYKEIPSITLHLIVFDGVAKLSSKETTSCVDNMLVQCDVKSSIYDFTFPKVTFDFINAVSSMKSWLMENKYNTIAEMYWKVAI